MAVSEVSFKRIVVVSYRLPFRIHHTKGQATLLQNSGGLVSAMLALSEKLSAGSKTGIAPQRMVWIGKGNETVSDFKLAERGTPRVELVPVMIPDAIDANYYGGFCNDMIWPLFHYFPELAAYNDSYFESYKKANQRFLAALMAVALPGDMIWIHDYQLMLLPAMVRERIPDALIGFFLHIPFPSFEIFRLMPRPWRDAVLGGMLGADMVGFHTFDYSQYFLRAFSRTLGYETSSNRVIIDGRVTGVDAFPIGIDFEKFNAASKSAPVLRKSKQIRKSLGDKRLIFSVDRLDYSKGFLHRLDGFEYFLETYPQWHEKVVFNMVVVPSRDSVVRYQEMKKEIEATVGRLNGKYGTISWRPIVYQYKSIPFEEMVALYLLSDVGLITPIRDGMNLVAKEYVACQTGNKGVLILSEMAGAASELSEAILINPTDRKEVGSAINHALLMPAHDREVNMNGMTARLKAYDVFTWADDFLGSVNLIQHEQSVRRVRLLDHTTEAQIIERYRHASRRLLFLDYDGTLVPFSRFPGLATPGKDTLRLLEDLVADPGNFVVIVSGRDRSFLDTWFGRLNITIVAEHGAFVKEAGIDWRTDIDNDQSWKPSVMVIMQRYANRCQGCRIEEKEMSLVWHYRNVEPESAAHYAKELHEELRELVSQDARIHLIDGHKIIEVKRTGYDKGTAAKRIIAKQPVDFLLALGDDKTDEDLFRSLPPEAITLKVGLTPSLAKYNLRSQNEVVVFIEQLLHA